MLKGIYEEKKAKCQSVSIEVRKTQHKYIIGQQAYNLYEILDKVIWQLLLFFLYLSHFPVPLSFRH